MITEPEHLKPTMTDRGFAHMPAIPATHGGLPAGQARVYESSSAMGAHLWLAVKEPVNRNHPEADQWNEATIHIAAEDAWRLADQIRALVSSNGARPDWAFD